MTGVRRALVAAALLGYLLCVLLPLVWVLWSSLKAGDRILGDPWALPVWGDVRWENYGRAWAEAGIGSAFTNSLVATVATLAVLLPIGAMAAYVLAKYAFPGAKAVSAGFMGGMMFPHFLVVVPLFLMLRQWGLLDTMVGLVLVYVAYSLSFTVFVLTGFFHALPDELAEAAMLDGCGHAGTFWRVMLPLARPGLIVVGIFNAIGLWNEYGLALVLLSSPQNRTLPLGVANLTMTQQYQSDWGALFAALVIVMLPVLLVYWLFKERIQEAMLAGAVKG